MSTLRETLNANRASFISALQAEKNAARRKKINSIRPIVMEFLKCSPPSDWVRGSEELKKALHSAGIKVERNYDGLYCRQELEDLI